MKTARQHNAPQIGESEPALWLFTFADAIWRQARKFRPFTKAGHVSIRRKPHKK